MCLPLLGLYIYIIAVTHLMFPWQDMRMLKDAPVWAPAAPLQLQDAPMSAPAAPLPPALPAPDQVLRRRITGKRRTGGGEKGSYLE